jgi:myo-inositol-1(or 4)-monophosphatase
MNSNELKQTLDIIQDIAFDAGEILLKFQKKRHNLNVKDKGENGIASDADVESEKFILGALNENFPDFYYLAEEDYNVNDKSSYQKAIDADYCWVIDPLDGTNNFVNGIPIYAVSIGLLQKGKPILGVVYNPTSGECFFAAKGLGAHLIDFRINPFKVYDLNSSINQKEMKDCIFSPAPVYEDTSKFEQQLSVFRKNIVGARAVRRLGSAALELCYVASGNFDGYWEKNLKPWDVAAAGIICLEAGVVVSNFNGQEYDTFDESIIAASNPLHSKILGKIAQK